MEFANPILGLAALASLLAILALHMFRRRFRRRETAGLFLWVGLLREDWPGRRFQKIQRSASLFCQLAAAALISLLLAGPRPSGMLESPHIVAVLDNSASMSARGADGAVFRDKGIEYLARSARELGGDATMTVVLTGERPEIIADPNDSASEALSKVNANWHPMMTTQSPQSALALAREFAPADGAILFITNREPAEGKGGAVYTYAIGEAMPNAGFVAGRREINPENADDTVFAAVKNYSHSLRSVSLEVSGFRNRERISLGRRTIDLEAMGTEYIVFEAPSDIDLIELELPEDAFSLDNKLRLLRAAPRRARVALDLPEGAARNRIMQAVNAVRDTSWTESPGDADLFIGSIPASLKSRARYALGVALSRESADDLDFFIGPYLLDWRHPLFDGVTFDGAVIAAPMREEAAALPFPEGSTPILSSGGRVLTVQTRSRRWERDGGTYLMDVDLARSNIHRSPDWPILISNLVELARDGAPGLVRSNYGVGESVRYNVKTSEPGEELVIQSDEFRRAVTIIYYVMDLPAAFPPGIYEIVENGEISSGFAVNFLDRTQSDLTGLSSNPPPGLADVAGLVEKEPSPAMLMILIILICALLMADWMLRKSGQARMTGRYAKGGDGA